MHEIEKLNSMLKELNYPVGSMNEVQGKAVRAFQNDFGLNVTGNFDEDTLNALKREAGENDEVEDEVAEEAMDETLEGKRNEGIDEVKENKEIANEIHNEEVKENSGNAELKKNAEVVTPVAECLADEDEKRSTIDDINEEIKKILMNGF